MRAVVRVGAAVVRTGGTAAAGAVAGGGVCAAVGGGTGLTWIDRIDRILFGVRDYRFCGKDGRKGRAVGEGTGKGGQPVGAAPLFTLGCSFRWVGFATGKFRWWRNPWPGVPPVAEGGGKAGHWAAIRRLAHWRTHSGIARPDLPNGG